MQRTVNPRGEQHSNASQTRTESQSKHRTARNMSPRKFSQPTDLQTSSPRDTEFGPLKIVGPRLRVSPEAEAVLLGASKPTNSSRGSRTEGDGEIAELRRREEVRGREIRWVDSVPRSRTSGGEEKSKSKSRGRERGGERFARLEEEMERLGLL